MELDAILMLIQMNTTGPDANSLLIMSSYIYNANIDINLSIRENIELILKEDEEMRNNGVINDILSSEIKYYDVKIYNLLLENTKMRKFLIGALKKNLLNKQSIIDIIETILTGVSSIERNSNRDQILQFLVEFISAKRMLAKDATQESLIINTFVKNTIPLLADDKSTSKDKLHDSFFDRIVLYKLFANGYATFYYDQILNPDSNENGIEEIVLPLIRSRSYGHLRLMINKVTIKEEDIEELKLVIKRGFKEFYDGDVDPHDAKMDASFIEKINQYFELIGISCLDYEEMAKPSFILS